MKKSNISYTCDVCGSEDIVDLSNGDNTLLKCEICKFIKKHDEDSIDNENFDDIIEHYSFTGTESILKQICNDNIERKPLNVLDIGCWDGSLLNCLPASWIKSGVEPNCMASKLAEQKNFYVFRKPLLNIDFKDKMYDLVLLLDVIEHLNDPLSSLKKIRKILKPSGSVIVLTGNTGSLGCRLFKNNWYYYNYKSHINFFNKDNLTLSLKKTGFKKISEIETKHYSTCLNIFFKRILKFKQRHSRKGTSKILMNDSSIDNAFLIISRIIRNKDHIIIKCGP